MSETLSPSEIESLFGGLDLSRATIIPDGQRTAGSQPSLASDQFTLPFTLATAEESAFQAWQAAFIERWRAGWSETFRTRFSLTGSTLSSTRLRDFVAHHAHWRAFQATSLATGRTVWFALDEQYVASQLDDLLGAGEAIAESHAPRPREWGLVEIQLMKRLVQGWCESLFPIAPEAVDAQWELTSLETAADWIAGVPVFLLCDLAQWEFEVSSSGATGLMHIGIPRTLGKPADVKRCEFSPPPNREPDFETTELRAILGPIPLSKAEFQELKIGDVLLTGYAAEAVCLVQCQDEAKFEATIGSHEGRKAVRLISSVPPKS